MLSGTVFSSLVLVFAGVCTTVNDCGVFKSNEPQALSRKVPRVNGMMRCENEIISGTI
ncbi:hypothetical protein GCM10027340_02580 [Marinomonas epiphytica]